METMGQTTCKTNPKKLSGHPFRNGRQTTCKTNPYVELMYNQYKNWSFDETASKNKGFWRSHVFKCEKSVPLDLEIGTGNGFHFAHLCQKHPERKIIGLELKYKTTIQSIRRSLRKDCFNGRMARFPAEKISNLFENGEVNNIYIHFPDPWPKKRHFKKRLIQSLFIKDIFSIMKPGCFLEFKTDDPGYFRWSMDVFKQSSFEISFFSEDIHNSFRQNKNFITHFESLFIKKGQPVFYCLLKKA